MKNAKVLNDYKLLVLLLSYMEWEEPDKVDNALIRKPLTDKVIKATNFSDIDDGALELLKLRIEKLACKSSSGLFGLFEIVSVLTDLATKHLIPTDDISLLKKFGIKDFCPSKIKNEILKIFVSEKFLRATVKNFRNDIEYEMDTREKEISKLGVSKDSSLDDSILTAFNKKLSSCKSFKEIEDLLLYYTTTVGGDLINAFLNGDLTVFNSKKPEVKSSWGTSPKVSFNLLLDSAIKALEFKKEIIYGILEHVTTVYRGIDLERLLRYTKITKDDLFDRRGCFDIIVERFKKDEKSKIQRRLLQYINKEKPIYQAKSVTSTSRDKNIAVEYHSKRHDIPILMAISLKEGTVFGKDFSKTSFGSDDYNKEIILMPSQKIQLNHATLKNDLITIECAAQ